MAVAAPRGSPSSASSRAAALPECSADDAIREVVGGGKKERPGERPAGARRALAQARGRDASFERRCVCDWGMEKGEPARASERGR